MFSFHKPKVYRSTQGCCICKAKSSSSRFTDSKKYEADFIECFLLSTPRKGEICNACVLLVKRFKRLPPGSERHWSHVVDARIGPGIKSMTKFKKRKEEQLMQQQNGDQTEYYPDNLKKSSSSTTNGSSNSGNGVTERFGKIFKKTKKKKAMEKFTKQKITTEQIAGSSDENSSPSSPSSNNSDVTEDVQMTDNNLSESKITARSTAEEIFNSLKCYEGTFYDTDRYTNDDEIKTASKRRITRKSNRPLKNRNPVNLDCGYLIDSEFWVQVKVCCGKVYENRKIGALLVDITELSQSNCSIHKRTEPKIEQIRPQEPSTVIVSPGTITAPVMKTVPLKKYQHFSKRNPGAFDFSYDSTANIKTDIALPITNTPVISTASIPITNEQTSAIDYSTNIIKPQNGNIKNKQKASADSTSTSSRAYNYLHKIKADSGRIVKNSLDRITPSKLKTDLNAVKNLVRLCTDKSIVNKKLSASNKNAGNAKITDKNEAVHNENENNSNKMIEALAGNKFSDNSSDSGYEETLHDTAQLNQIAKVGSSKPVILSNGVKIHVQPQNLLYAANLAGVSATAIETTQASLKASLLNQQTHSEQHLPFGTNITPIPASGTQANTSNQNHIQNHQGAPISISAVNEQHLYAGIKSKALPLAPVITNN